MVFEFPSISSGYFFRLFLEVSHDSFDADLIDQAEALGADAHADEALFAGDPDALIVEVGQEATLGLIVRVADAIAADRLLSRNLTKFRHD